MHVRLRLKLYCSFYVIDHCMDCKFRSSMGHAAFTKYMLSNLTVVVAERRDKHRIGNCSIVCMAKDLITIYLCVFPS